MLGLMKYYYLCTILRSEIMFKCLFNLWNICFKKMLILYVISQSDANIVHQCEIARQPTEKLKS